MSMFALGAQQPGQTVALLLRPAAWEDLMQIAIAALRRLPLLAEMPDHLTHLRLHAVPLEVSAQIADHLPVLVGEFEAFLARERMGKVLGPVAEVQNVAFRISQHRPATDAESFNEGCGLQHRFASLSWQDRKSG